MTTIERVGLCTHGACTRKAHRSRLCVPHWKIAKSRGLVGNVDTTEVRAYIAHLQDRGWPAIGIARTSGVSTFCVNQLIAGQPTTNVRNVRAILAVPDVPSGPRQVSAHGARRRYQALLFLGWPSSTLAARMGLASGRSLETIMSRKYVTRRVDEAMRGVYEELSATPGPNAATAAKARDLGYAPPLAWHDIDDARETPTAVARGWDVETRRRIKSARARQARWKKGRRDEPPQEDRARALLGAGRSRWQVHMATRLSYHQLAELADAS